MLSFASPLLRIRSDFVVVRFRGGSLVREIMGLLLALACVAIGSRAGAATGFTEALDSPGLTWQTGGDAPWSVQTSITHDGIDAAGSGTITDGQQTWIETTMVGPGPVGFWWRVSSELGYDQFQFLVDGSEQLNISGDVNWQVRTFNLPAGVHVLRWSYVKDATDLGGADRAWLDAITYSPPGDAAPVMVSQPVSQSVASGGFVSLSALATGVPEPVYQWFFNGTLIPGATNRTYTIATVTSANAGSYWVMASNLAGTAMSTVATLIVTFIGDALEAGELNWVVGGEAPWGGQSRVTHDGVDAGESGVITNSQQSWVQATVNGPGVLSFWWKVSSEAFYDGLQFLTNGVVAASLSGESVWEQRTFTLPAGALQLRWRYFKDGSLTMGEDRGWLDEVTYVGNKPPTALGLTLDPPVINENQTVSLTGSFVDPDLGEDHRLTINWGDGSVLVMTTLAPGVGTFNSVHQYSDDPLPGGPDTNVITVTVADEAGSTTSEARLRVNNVAPVLGGLAMNPVIYPYDTVTLSGGMNDAGPLDALRLTVNWADGSPLQTTNYPAGTSNFSLRHRFTLSKTNLVITLGLSDDDAGTTIARTNLSIRPLPAAARLSSVQRPSSGAVRLTGQGTAGANYLIEASEDLRRWSAVAVCTALPNDVLTYAEVERARYPARFYRAVWGTQSPAVRFGDIWMLTNGQVRIKLVGRPLTGYRVERAAGFTNWANLMTVITDTNGVGLCDDTPAPGQRRNYRAVEP